jgi:phosphoglycolate phosphatase-like HAD superfamily hydrolase
LLSKRELEMGKKEIGLIVSDIDNTVSDYFNNWALSFEQATALLSRFRKEDKEVIYKYIYDTMSGYDIFGDNVSRMVKKLDVPKAKGLMQRFQYMMQNRAIISKVNKRRLQREALYDGVIQTLSKAKQSGTKIVFYTDATMSTAVKRLANSGMPVDLIDGLYANNEGKKNARTAKKYSKKVAVYEKQLRNKLKNKMCYTDGHKPSEKQIKQILADANIKNSRMTVMTGDNIRSDGGTAKAGDMEFAWQKKGTEFIERLLPMYDAVNQLPEYRIDTQGQLQMIKETGITPDVVLENGFADLEKYYEFVDVKKASV